MINELDRNILNINVNCLFNNNEPLSMELLENNIQVEKMEYQKGRYLKEDEIQEIVIQYLLKRGIEGQGSCNGHNADFSTIRYRQKMGQSKGIPDIHIDKWNGVNNTFYLELKKMGGRLKDSQKKKIAILKNEYIPVSVSWGLYDAIYKIEKYLQGTPLIYEA